MKLIMASSANNFVARSESDNMSWTGSVDKAVFKLLTSTSDILAVSAKSLQYMPNQLPGRGRIYALSTNPGQGVSLEDLAPIAPDAWLLGGQELALYAMKNGFVSKVYMCRSPVELPKPEGEDTRIEDKIQPYLERRRYQKGRGSWWDAAMQVKIDDFEVHVWERHSAVRDDA